MRKFSQNGKSVNLYNLKSKKKIENAPIKSQCSEDYFYGSDGVIEDAYGMVETKFSLALDECTRLGPKGMLSPESQYMVILFISTQFGRTRSQKNTINKFFDTLMKEIAKHEGVLQDIDPDTYSLKYSAATKLMAMHSTLDHYLMLDLDYVILKNETCDEYILSDNPVIFQNPLFEKYSKQTNLGIVSRGLQVYYPINPRTVVCLYDKAVYDYGSKKVVSVHSNNDVFALNALQMSYADNNVYFMNDQFEFDNLNVYFERSRVNVSNQVKGFTSSDNSRYLLGLSALDIRIGLKLKAFKIRSNWLKTIFELASNKGVDSKRHVRDEIEIRIHENYLKAVENKEIKASEYFTYRKSLLEKWANQRCS